MAYSHKIYNQSSNFMCFISYEYTSTYDPKDNVVVLIP